MLVSHRYGFIFVKTRKTAGTSMEIALSRFLGPDDVITPISPEDEALRTTLGGRSPQNCDAFANHMTAADIKARVPQWDDYFKWTIERNPWDLAVSAYWWHSRLYDNPRSFRRFVFSRLLKRYSNWPLYTIDDIIVMDSIIPYYQLADRLPALSKQLGVPELELPSAKSSFRPDRDFTSMYGQLERWRVGQVFRREIRAFGWKFWLADESSATSRSPTAI